MKALFALLLAIPSASLADPGPPIDHETCGFLPLEVRMTLPPDNPCYLPPDPPPPVCYDEHMWAVDCPL